VSCPDRNGGLFLTNVRMLILTETVNSCRTLILPVSMDNTQATGSSKTSANLCQTARCHIPGNSIHFRENTKAHKFLFNICYVIVYLVRLEPSNREPVVTWRCGVIRTNVSRHSCLFLRNMGLQPFYGNGPHPLLSAGSRAARGKLTSGIPACLNCCEIFMVYKQFANAVTGRVIQPGGPHVTDPCCVSADIRRIVCL
jgi:hypothetical protein